MKLKPTLQKALKAIGLVWDDIVPILGEFDSVDDINKMMTDPWGKLKGVALLNVPLAIKLAIMYLKPLVQKQLKTFNAAMAGICSQAQGPPHRSIG